MSSEAADLDASRWARRMVEALIPVVIALGSLGLPSSAATIDVTDCQDPGDAVCDASCTLREALEVANANGVPDVIRLNGCAVEPVATSLRITEGLRR